MSTTYNAALYATERRAIMFVDAGFVLQIMQAHHEVSTRSQLAIDHPKLVDALTRRLEEFLGCPVLRIYWYDAVHPSGKVPNLVAAEMARVDGVKVRLGTLHARPDGRWEQKAVDTLLVRDMIAHAYKRTANEMVLLSGDNDLVPGVEEAQEQGVRVHLWSIRGDDLPPSVGRALANLADSRLELEADELAESIRAVVHEGPVVPESTLAPADHDHHGDQAVAPSPLELAKRAAAKGAADPTQKDVRPSTAAQREMTSAARSHTAAVLSTGDDAFPRLYDLDRDAYNAPVAHGDDANATGMEYAARWAAATDAALVTQLFERFDAGFSGNIPRPVDADLLYFGGDHGLDTYATLQKFALRKGFWLGIEAVMATPTRTE